MGSKKKKISTMKPVEIKQSKIIYLTWLIKNILLACITALLIKMVVYPFGEENTLLHNIYNDMRRVSKVSLNSVTLDERYTSLLKNTYLYFKLIKDNSPADAVILYPEYEAFFPENEEHVFTNPGVSSKMWAIRFLYPRIIIKQSELESSPYKDKITYVAIVNGRGREFLPYEIDEDANFGVIVLNPTEKELQFLKSKNKE